MSKTVTMYGGSWCQPCKQVKPKLIKKAIDEDWTFEYIDVEDDPCPPEVHSVPTVFVKDGPVTSGPFVGVTDIRKEFAL
ncbi:hypothetical protein ABZV77_11360 [Streptomyces sp. NPDC004732]|uniref:glutaredoxin family protein n=1 Tax=Streptomyces sp. NPDC004732 TaxID=3154290 RepID=UPI0033B834D2